MSIETQSRDSDRNALVEKLGQQIKDYINKMNYRPGAVSFTALMVSELGKASLSLGDNRPHELIIDFDLLYRDTHLIRAKVFLAEVIYPAIKQFMKDQKPSVAETESALIIGRVCENLLNKLVTEFHNQYIRATMQDRIVVH